MIRALGWLLLGGLLGGLGYWYVREHGFPWESPPKDDDEPRTVEREADERDVPPVMWTATVEPPAPVRCCIRRSELGPLQLYKIDEGLARRWPNHSINRLDQIRPGDRVAFLVEVGSSPSSVHRELVTGRVLMVGASGYEVQIEHAPELAHRHGLHTDATIDIPRDAVLVWSAANVPPRNVPIDWQPERDRDDEGLFVRQASVGQRFDLALPPGHEALRVEVEPESAKLALDHIHGDVARLMWTQAPRGRRVELRLVGDGQWGPTLDGRWAFQF